MEINKQNEQEIKKGDVVQMGYDIYWIVETFFLYGRRLLSSGQFSKHATRLYGSTQAQVLTPDEIKTRGLDEKIPKF